MLKSQTLPAPNILPMDNIVNKTSHEQIFKPQNVPLPEADMTPQEEPLPDADLSLPESQGTNPECTIQCIHTKDNSVSYAGRTYW